MRRCQISEASGVAPERKKTPGVTEKGLEGLEDVRERGGDMEGAEGC